MRTPMLFALSICAAALIMNTVACGGGAADAVPATPSAAPSPDPAPEAVQVSSIEVYSKDGTEIQVDGKSIGKAPIKKYELPPGTHDVTFVDPVTGNRTMGVNLAPGDHQVVTSDPPPNANMNAPGPKGK